MIQIEGTDYAEPTDKAIVSKAAVDYVLCTVGDAGKRVSKSEFGGDAHDHEDEYLYPKSVAKGPGQTYLQVGQYPNYIRMYDASGTLGLYCGGVLIVDAVTMMQIYSGTGSDCLRLVGESGKRHALGDSWYTYACSLNLKENVVKIPDSVEKCKSIEGITYTQDGIDGIGVTAEDLDALGLPNLTHKDKDGKYESINLVGLIPVLVEAISELSARVDELEGKQK